MMKKTSGMILFISFVLILIAFPAFGQGEKKTPLRIGGVLSMTGTWAEAGKYVKGGIEAWVDEINKKGGLLGRPVEMIIYDNESDTDKAVTYYERLITVDKVDLVCGCLPGTANPAVMPLVEKYGKVFIGMGGHMKSFEQGFTYTFGSPPLMSDWAYLTLAGVLDDLIPKAERPKTMAIFTMNTVTGLSARGPLIKSVEDRGVKVVVDETYNLPLTDAVPLISKAKARGAEILSSISVFDDGVLIMRAAKSLRYNPKLVWELVASKVPAWMKELGEDGNNVLSNTFWAPDLPYAGNDKIIQAAKDRMKIPQPPDYYGYGYCWMKTLEMAVEGTKSFDDKKIRDYLRSRKFDLPYGKGISFDSKGLPSPFCYTIQTVNGENKLIWPKSVATTKLVYPRPDWSK
jgi:branched-chain amino acid transport system substrate-binding protein